MNIRLMSILAVAFCATAISFAQSPKRGWRMVWNDEFNSPSVDTTKWSRIVRGTSNWDRYMDTKREDLVVQSGGEVRMLGVVNPDRTRDTVAYLTGGLWSKGKFSFLYGKIEIRAKLQCVKGAWPAFWMLPESGAWPSGGEIDIMEHLNFDDFIYQTVHSYYTIKLGIKDNPPHGGRGKIDREGYNVYGLEWTEDKLTFFVNGQETFSYPRIQTDKQGQWPFDTPFYILIDQQLGGRGTWVGEVADEQLPATISIDYVRVYSRN